MLIGLNCFSFCLQRIFWDVVGCNGDISREIPSPTIGGIMVWLKMANLDPKCQLFDGEHEILSDEPRWQCGKVVEFREFGGFDFYFCYPSFRRFPTPDFRNIGGCLRNCFALYPRCMSMIGNRFGIGSPERLSPMLPTPSSHRPMRWLTRSLKRRWWCRRTPLTRSRATRPTRRRAGSSPWTLNAGRPSRGMNVAKHIAKLKRALI